MQGEQCPKIGGTPGLFLRIREPLLRASRAPEKLLYARVLVHAVCLSNLSETLLRHDILELSCASRCQQTNKPCLCINPGTTANPPWQHACRPTYISFLRKKNLFPFFSRRAYSCAPPACGPPTLPSLFIWKPSLTDSSAVTNGFEPVDLTYHSVMSTRANVSECEMQELAADIGEMNDSTRRPLSFLRWRCFWDEIN